jgi:hypothetical protein
MRYTVCCLGWLLAMAGMGRARDLTVLLDYERPGSVVASHSMERELTSILANAHMQVHVMAREAAANHAQFGDLVLFHMRGSCSMQELPIAAVSDERGPLAMTFTSDGEPLHFGEVKCDRVRRSVLRTVDATSLQAQSQMWQDREYGVALARVMAHEIYHMLAQSTEHTKTGVTKRALSSSDLRSAPLRFSEDAKSRMTLQK